MTTFATPISGVVIPLLATVLFALLMCASAMSAVIFASSYAGARLTRGQLAWRLKGTRMARMLQRLGIEEERYVAETPVSTMRAQLDTCSSCRRKAECDEALDYTGLKRKTFAFCPNKPALHRIFAV